MFLLYGIYKDYCREVENIVYKIPCFRELLMQGSQQPYKISLIETYQEMTQ